MAAGTRSSLQNRRIFVPLTQPHLMMRALLLSSLTRKTRMAALRSGGSAWKGLVRSASHSSAPAPCAVRKQRRISDTVSRFRLISDTFSPRIFRDWAEQREIFGECPPCPEVVQGCSGCSHHKDRCGDTPKIDGEKGDVNPNQGFPVLSFAGTHSLSKERGKKREKG